MEDRELDAAVAKRARQRKGSKTQSSDASVTPPHEPTLTQAAMSDVVTEVTDRQLEEAAEAVRQMTRTARAPYPPALMLELHGLFIQAKHGDAPPPPEGGFNVRADERKWNSWAIKSGASKADARSAYIGLVSQIASPGPFCVMLCSDRSPQGQRALQQVCGFMSNRSRQGWPLAPGQRGLTSWISVAWQRAMPILAQRIRVLVIANQGVGEEVQVVMNPTAGPAPTKELTAAQHAYQMAQAAMSDGGENRHMYHSLPPRALNVQLQST